MNISIEESKAGLLPVIKDLNYEISTKMVENYLQTELNLLTQKNGEEEIHINADTFRAGPVYYPIIVTLPPVTLTNIETSSSMHTKDDFCKQFSYIKEDSKSMYMRDDFYRVFSAISYNNDVVSIIEEIPTLKEFLHSKRLTFGKGSEDSVVFEIIDPIMLFHKMLEIDNDTRNFKVYVDKVIKIEDSNYMYHITRRINPPNKNKYIRWYDYEQEDGSQSIFTNPSVFDNPCFEALFGGSQFPE